MFRVSDQKNRIRSFLSSLTTFQRIFFHISILFIVFGSIGILLVNLYFETAVSIPTLVVLIIFCSATVAYVAAKVSLSEMGRLITQFTESAKEIARGNFDHKINIYGHDDIVQLSRIFNYMTIELKRINQININRIIREQIKTEAILRNIADGVIVTGPAGDTVLINQVVEQWLGVNEKDILGSSINFYLPELKQIIYRTIQPGEKDIVTEIIDINDISTGELLILGAHSSQVSDHGELIAVVIVLRNITKEKEIDRMKTELVSVVAHELRSPLTSIAGFSEVLKDPNLAESTRKEYIEIINYESGRLAEMINKFLDLSRIESGQTMIYKVQVDIISIINSALNINSYWFTRKNITVHTNFPDNPVLIQCDPNLISQVMMNLISNAIKYSPEQSRIYISVTLTENQVVIRVQDTGFGISQENLKHIFKKFFRAKDDRRIKEIEGTGLGLAFVKEIVHQHNGQIIVESELSTGTAFIITLPHIYE
jgi:PAS domain S-box-containing protein